jgi:arsenite methyltransferase
MSSFEESISGKTLGVEGTKVYYEELKDSSDLKTNACCTSSAPPPEIRAALQNVCDESMSKYYGYAVLLPLLPFVSFFGVLN